MTKLFIYGTLILGLSCLALGWIQAGFQVMGLALFALIPVSLVLVYRRFRPILGIIFGLTVLVAAIGLWAGVGLSLSLLASVCALVSWDLDAFLRRLAFASEEDNPEQLERQHLMQVNLLMLIGVGINLFSQTIHFAYGFEWAFGLAILSFYGIGVLFNAMKTNM